MAFKMPHPVTRPSGVYHLNVRVPSDLMKVVPGTTISLPLEDATVRIKATDKVVLSLRTKDVASAKTRFTIAYGALCRHFEAVRAGPVTLSYKQIVALAGDFYRKRSARLEVEYDPDRAAEDRWRRQDAIDEWRYGDGDGLREIPLYIAEFYAAMQRPSGPYLFAFEQKADYESDIASVTYAEALEHLFGSDADALCAERQLLVDQGTRTRLLAHIGEVVRLAADRVTSTLKGDFSPDPNLARFPAFEGPAAAATAKAPATAKGVTVEVLFERWKAFNADHVARSTIRRYGPSIASLAAFMGSADVRSISKADVERWADHRRDVDGIGPGTINRNDLVAAASLFSFATSRESDADAKGEKRPLRGDNPVRGVKLKEPVKQTVREKKFRVREISEILTLARQVVPDASYPKASAARRFAPFICAYSGARIQEVFWLTKADIWQEGSIFVMRFPMTKNGIARTVPIHDAIVEEGLLDDWRSARSSLLFASDRAQKPDASRSQAEQRASEMATWITSRVTLSSGASPNHGWRHTFISRAQGPVVRMSREMACAIAATIRTRTLTASTRLSRSRR